MKQLRFIVLIIALNLMAFSILSAFLTSDSPGYDAWKIDQIKPISNPTDLKTNVPQAEVYREAQRSFDLLIPLDGTFTLALAPNDDGYSSQLFLPFTFSLYGQDYTSCWINNNGNVTFDRGYSSYTPWGFPINEAPMLAPFFADVDTRGAGTVSYKIEPNRMIVIWDHVGYYGSHSDKLNTFELIFTNGTDTTIGIGNTVAFSFADMSWTTGDASSGSGGFGGTPATVGNNKGDGIAFDQIGRFDHAGYDYDGPFNDNDGVDWLDGKIFYFGTGTSATLTIFPSTYDYSLPGVEPPAAVDPDDPGTDVYYASYPLTANLDVQLPVGEGIFRGWIYYNSMWHMADVFPVNGPGTVSFSDVPFGGRNDVPFLIVREDGTLPVELSSFTAAQTAQNFVKLTWITQSETALMGYHLYRNDMNNHQTAQMITPVLIGATNTSSTQIYDYTDAEVEIGKTYWYWLESVDYNNSQFFGPISFLVEGDTPAVNPQQTSMRDAYPNPFKISSGTTIEVDVKDNDAGKVTIYNIIGQEVISFPVTPGNNSINWNGKNSRGSSCPTGIYFYKLGTKSMNQTRKLLIIK